MKLRMVWFLLKTYKLSISLTMKDVKFDEKFVKTRLWDKNLYPRFQKARHLANLP